MKPIIPPKYDIGFYVTNCTPQLLEALEPWCSRIHVNLTDSDIDAYIYKEQQNTIINLNERINTNEISEIDVYIDGMKFQQNEFNLIMQLPMIIQDSGEVGDFQIGNLRLKINTINEYQNDLIKL